MQKFRMMMTFITLTAWAFLFGILLINDFYIYIDRHVNICLWIACIGSISGILSYTWSIDQVETKATKEINAVKEKYNSKLQLVGKLQFELTQYIHDNFKTKTNEHKNSDQQS